MWIHRALTACALAVLPAGLSAAEMSAPGYLGSAVCADCHEEAAADWAGSHHALAWTWPGPDTVVADFDGTAFEGNGMSVRFRIEDGLYFADVTESDGSRTEYPVHSVAGIEPLQQYLLETEEGRLQSFDVVWDTEKGGWFHLYGDGVIPPDDGLHWTGPYKTWNARCAECHATGYDKNYDPATRTYASQQIEIGVGCEACHGPGAEHVAWAERWQTTREPPPPLGGFAIDVADTEATIQQCATCHSRREAHGDGNPMPGTAYHDAYSLALLRPGQYHADGQILDEVYVYGSFLQSKMYAAGVGCIDCHEAHSADLRAEGNAVCAQCHSPAGNPRFPELNLADYDSPEHHFHEAGSAAAQCKSCHMVEQVYMGNDWRADHSSAVPAQTSRPRPARRTPAPPAMPPRRRTGPRRRLPPGIPKAATAGRTSALSSPRAGPIRWRRRATWPRSPPMPRSPGSSAPPRCGSPRRGPTPPRPSVSRPCWPIPTRSSAPRQSTSSGLPRRPTGWHASSVFWTTPYGPCASRPPSR